MNDWLRGLAGFFILVSLALALLVHSGFLFFTAFVGANLLQSAFTKYCPAMTVLRKLGVEDDRRPARESVAVRSPAVSRG